MKKIFKLTDEKKHEDRVLEAVKNDIRKYVKREKKKKLEDAKTTYWDFDCKIGASADMAKEKGSSSSIWTPFPLYTFCPSGIVGMK